MSATLMNISSQNVVGTCESKCYYSFNYPMTNATTITNYGSYLQFTYELSGSSPVLYNSRSYNVSSINIYSPSLHLYNNTVTDGEVVIRHVPVNGGNPLYVIIPLSTTGVTTKATRFISQVILAASKSAPSAGNNTNKGVTNFTLNDFVPMKPFFSYTTSQMDCIVFDLSNAIGISVADLNMYKKIITTPPTNPFMVSTSLFTNPKGPRTMGGSDIYIDCQPTDQVVEEVTKEKTTVDDTTSDQNVMYILYGLAFILLIVVFYYIFKTVGLIGSGEGSSETLPTMKGGGFFRKKK